MPDVDLTVRSPDLGCLSMVLQELKDVMIKNKKILDKGLIVGDSYKAIVNNMQEDAVYMYGGLDGVENGVTKV